MTRADRRRLTAAALVLAGSLALTACDAGSAAPGGASSAAPSTPSGPPAPEAYAALGDSYAAAPFVPTTDVAGGCFRSTGNYPSLVAEQLEPSSFVDVTCSGADSADVGGPQRVVGGEGTVPPQIRAVRPVTDLVTVGIGGNDGDLFSQLVCGFTRQRFAACDVSSTADVEDVLVETRRSVTAALRRVVRRAAPDALVLLVGYPRLVTTDRACPALPLKGADQAQVSRVERRIRATLRSAASRAGVGFLDLWPASRGHEVCSDDPWVNGNRTDRSRALAYHPFAAEQQAVAALVEQRWREHAS